MSADWDELARRYERFVIGQTFQSCGIHFRIENGKKMPGDLRLDWYTTNGWTAVTFEPVFFMTDFLYENEDWLHPRPREKGGEYLFQGLRRAIKHGHASAWRYVEAEKANKGTQGRLFS